MIFTFGDGFATGHIWPEWPQILQALLPKHQIINIAAIGAGPEFLISCLVDHLPTMAGQYAIIQWPQPNRFDKLLEDDSWDNVIDNDPKYHFNRVHDTYNRTWWLSSGSSSLTEYHNYWVQPGQHLRRINIYKELAKQTLENIDCKYYFTTTADQDKFSQAERFRSIRQNQIQPSPIVHFYWLVENVLPNIEIQPEPARIKWVEEQLLRVNWIAYDPERENLWNNIVNAK